MILLLLLGIAAAFDAYIIPVDGPAVVGRPAVIEVLALDSFAQQVEILAVELDGEPLLAARPGTVVQRFILPAPREPGSLSLTVRTQDHAESAAVVIGERPGPRLVLPDRVEVDEEREVVVPLDAPAGTRPDQVHAFASEAGALEVIERDGLFLRFAAQERGARAALIGATLKAEPADPVFTRVSYTRSVPLAFDLEPGASLRAQVGGRRYGPAAPGADGMARLKVLQRPGETSARLTVADDLGNELQSSLLLSTRPEAPALLLPENLVRAGSPAPGLLVAMALVDGSWRSAPTPSCTYDGSVARTTPAGAGRWRVEPPALIIDQRPVHVRCQGPDGEVQAELRPPPGTPQRLAARFSPTQVSADRPRAEVEILLLDAYDQRLPIDHVEITAIAGSLQDGRADDRVYRADYRLEDTERGQDRITASWSPPPGKGSAHAIEVMPIPTSDGIQLVSSVRDQDLRPLAGVPVRLRLGETSLVVDTDSRGVAKAAFSPPSSPTVVSATAAGRTTATWFWSTRPAPQIPPGPALFAAAELEIVDGEVSSLSIRPSARSAETGQGSPVTLLLDLRDKSGRMVHDVVPVVEASEGVLGPVQSTREGRVSVTWQPPVETRSRVATITARTPSSGAQGQVEIRLTPRVPRLLVGISAGASSNLRALSSPSIGGEVEIGVSTALRGLMVRAGLSSLSYRRDVESTVGEGRATIRLLPLHVAGLVRRPTGPVDLHAGGGVVVAPFRAEQRFGEDRLPARYGVTIPGLIGIVGASRRIGDVDLMLEGRYQWILSEGAVSGFAGQLGGLGAHVGFRLRID